MVKSHSIPEIEETACWPNNGSIDQPLVEAVNLTKTFSGGQVAVSGLDLVVRAGSVSGLIGRNGAGKTTTLRLLMGLLHPDHGSARILGRDFRSAPRWIRERVAYVSQNQRLPGWMTLAELCRYISRFYRHWDQRCAGDLAQQWELSMTRPVASLSGGEQRQIAILLAVSARPSVLLLDEPAAGLDPIARRSLLSAIVGVLSERPEAAVLFSTHYVGDLERVADHVAIMDRGRLLSAMRMDSLMQKTRRVQVVFDAPEPPRDFTIPGARTTRTRGPVVTAIATISDEEQLACVRAMPGVRVDVFPVDLEELFIEWLGPVSNWSWDGGPPGPDDTDRPAGRADTRRS